MYLSKSDYLKYLVHPAYLWYQKHAKTKLPPVTDDDQYVFDQGHAFESLVQSQYEDAVEIQGKPWEFAQLTTQTASVLNSDAEVIFQATFLTQRGLLCRCDILERNGIQWNLTEVKASTRVKDTHLKDLAFQKIALAEAGIEVAKVSVIHIDSNYKREGEINASQIAKIRNVTEQIDEILEQTHKNIDNALEILEQVQPDDHPVYANDLRSWMPIYEHIHGGIPEDSVLRLTQLKPQQLRNAHYAGVETIDQVDDSAQLSPKQLNQVRTFKKGEPEIDRTKIAKFLEGLEFPLYFLDYETAAYALPFWDGTKPYQQVPFQYSLHILTEVPSGGPTPRTGTTQGGPTPQMVHKEYLAQGDDFPVPALVDRLLEDIGDRGSVLVWYRGFECAMNTQMGKWLPGKAAALDAINSRVVDLMDPFAKQWYVDHRFGGSASIKNVLPVIAPKHSYKSLGIQNGASAQRKWQQAVFEGKDADKTMRDLRKYCALDTLAMVEIYQFLHELVKSEASSQSQASLFDL